jgi:TPR repeat protein
MKILNKILCLFALANITLLASESELLKQGCLENNVTACYLYALPLLSGENDKVQDLREEGMGYMKKACVFGEDKACDIMGEKYYADAGYIAARPYLIASCKRGIKSACEAVGTIYRDGHDVKPDDVLSREFYERACDLKSGDACYNVAIIYRGGFGVVKSRKNEKIFYKKSCEAGLKAGCNRYTELDNEDKGIDVGIISKIKKWFN